MLLSWEPIARGTKTRILVAFGDEYRAYRGVIAAGIRVLRPHDEVKVTGLDVLREEIEGFDPQVVVSSHPSTSGPGSRFAWIELSLNPLQPSKMCLDGRRWEITSPMLEDIVAIIEESEILIRTKNGPGNC